MYSLSINVTDRVCLPEDIDSCLVSEMLVEVYADRAVAELITVTVGIDVSVRRKQSDEHLEDLLMIIRYQRQLPTTKLRAFCDAIVSIFLEDLRNCDKNKQAAVHDTVLTMNDGETVTIHPHTSSSTIVATTSLSAAVSR